MQLEECINILTRLVGFESISARPNEPIVSYIQEYLASCGVESTLSYGDAGLRANLFATIGPEQDGGVVFNGHTDFTFPIKATMKFHQGMAIALSKKLQGVAMQWITTGQYNNITTRQYDKQANKQTKEKD